MTTYYECHITMAVEPDPEFVTNRPFLRHVVESHGWKFSVINVDANLGAGQKAYATRQYNKRFSQAEMLEKLHFFGDLIADHGIKILRRKIELVLFDDRSSKVDACNGGCVECHLDDLEAT